ncbi:MAG: hypothetical protein GF331_13710 [Chitinivibrionales bacterium]|nr:hypothetical protein [Chitinivibrionales bacterium]
MKTMHEKAVREAFVQVLGKMAFLFAEPVEKRDIDPFEGEWLLVSMRFRGELAGTLDLAMPTALCREVAAGVLGEDPESDKAQTRAVDAALELLNVTCGQVLTAIAGEQPKFDLSAPSAESPSSGTLHALAEVKETVAFAIDDYTALLRLTTKESTP